MPLPKEIWFGVEKNYQVEEINQSFGHDFNFKKQVLMIIMIQPILSKYLLLINQLIRLNND